MRRCNGRLNEWLRLTFKAGLVELKELFPLIPFILLQVFKDRKWLGSIRYTDGKMTVNERKMSGQIPCPKDYNECLQTARNLFNKARKVCIAFFLLVF